MEWSSPENLAIKLFQKTASDLIAKNSTPQYLLLNINIPHSEKFITPFLNTIYKQCQKHSVLLVGGDTSYSSQIVLSATMIGKLSDHTYFIPRKSLSILQENDIIALIGSPGVSLAGFKALQSFSKTCTSSINPQTIQQQLLPTHPYIKQYLEPRAKWECLEIFKYIVPKITMDQSDTLWEVFHTWSSLNNINIHLNIETCPINTPALNQETCLSHSTKHQISLSQLFIEKYAPYFLFGSEDFSITCVFSQSDLKKLQNLSKKHNIAIIGHITLFQTCNISKVQQNSVQLYYRNKSISKEFYKKYTQEHINQHLYEHFSK